MNRVLVFSVISPDKEGRLKKTLELLTTRYLVTLVCPKSGFSLVNLNLIGIGEERPVGIKAQIRYVSQIKKALRNKKIIGDFNSIYIANVLSVPGGMQIKKYLGIEKCIYDAYEIFFTKRTGKQGIKNKFYLLMEKSIIKKADLIIEANYERALLAQGFYQLESLPIVVSNFNYKVDSQIDKINKYDNEKIKVGYVGYISKERRVHDLIKEIGNNSEIELHIYGNGKDAIGLADEVEINKYKNVFFHGEYQIQELQFILSSIDVGYIFYPQHNYNNIYCEPNKIYEYCANGIPMISYMHPKLNHLFDTFHIGCADDSIIESIKTIMQSIDTFRKACKESYFQTQLSVNQKYLDRIDSVM